MFGLGSKLKAFEDKATGKWGVAEKEEFVPQYSFDSKAEAEEYIKEHGKEVEAENG